ncbi:PRD domain-containing protein [Enterococcus sp. CWB-B31]|uniref:PRD domain-containing protein n=1 Tax=Enterococcus sp. CWB-B31 TaxID=2885159 RepID=UPI001E3CB22A|nr:PRD domain-containing protein [Enterococcus sp. CWB-B31]MCB5953893.1 PRD domain-containing protein [Enterococcus sp. CWB-B31]
MYRIVKPLNNNIAVVRLENGEQAIAMGKGIAFQKKKGELVPEAAVSNLFLLRDEEVQHNFAELLKNVPLEYIRTTYEVIDKAIENYQYAVQEYLYITLTDHVYWSCGNLKKGLYVPSKLPDFAQQYPIETAIGKYAIKIIRERISPEYPEDEAARIALHFINAKREKSSIEPKTSQKMSILSFVESELNRIGIRRTQENQNFYDRLMIHLMYFTKNLDREAQNPNKLSQNLDEHLKFDYPKAYEIGNYLYQLIKNKSGRELSSTERIYLTLHMQRLL